MRRVLDFSRKLAVLVLLLVMPLQSVAASLSVLQCPAAEAGATRSSNTDDGAGQERDGDGVKTFFEHFFCHQLSSGIPVSPAAAAAPDIPVFDSSIFILPSLFFPEQPQRPPFSASA